MNPDEIRAASGWLRGDDAAARLARRSLEALVGHEVVSEAFGNSPIYVHLEDPAAEGKAVSAVDASRMLSGFQRGVARIVKARAKALSDVKRLAAEDFEFARIDVVSASPGSLDFVLAPHGTNLPESTADVLHTAGGTRVGSAVDSLIRALPSDADDVATVEGIAAIEPLMRHAVQDFVDAIEGRLNATLELGVGSEQRPRAALTREQARTMSEILASPVTSDHTEVRVGLLDGIRTTRRVFYLITDTDDEIHGVMDEDVVSVARELLGSRVNAHLRVVETRNKAGNKTTRSYALVDLDVAQTLPMG